MTTTIHVHNYTCTQLYMYTTLHVHNYTCTQLYMYTTIHVHTANATPCISSKYVCMYVWYPVINSKTQSMTLTKKDFSQKKPSLNRSRKWKQVNWIKKKSLHFFGLCHVYLPMNACLTARTSTSFSHAIGACTNKFPFIVNKINGLTLNMYGHSSCSFKIVHYLIKPFIQQISGTVHVVAPIARVRSNCSINLFILEVMFNAYYTMAKITSSIVFIASKMYSQSSSQLGRQHEVFITLNNQGVHTHTHTHTLTHTRT